MGLKIEYENVGSLKPYKGNARTHSKKQIKQLTSSIKEFGFTNPILIDEGKAVLAGHGRLMAAKEMGVSKVPCVRIENMSEAQKRAYIIADNKLALNAGWDEELLAEELGFLLSEETAFDVNITGFSIAEVDMIIEDSYTEEPNDPEDDLPVNDKGLKDVFLGDVWQLGRHRLICGDSLSPDVVQTLMNGKKARMIFTDPPYNVPIDGFVGGKGKIKHKDFAMATGEMTEVEFTRFLIDAFNQSERDFSVIKLIMGGGAFASFQDFSAVKMADVLEMDGFDVLFMYGLPGIMLYGLSWAMLLYRNRQFNLMMLACLMMLLHSAVAGHVFFNGLLIQLVIVINVISGLDGKVLGSQNFRRTVLANSEGPS